MTLPLNMKLTPFKDVKLLRLEECRWKKAKHESLSWQFKTHILLIFYRFRAVWTKNLCNEKSLSFWRIITSVFTVSFRTYTTCLWTKKPTQKMKKTNKTKLKNIEVLKKITQSEREMHKKKKMDGWDSAEGSVLIHQTSNVCKLPRAWQCAIDTKNLHPCWKTILQNLFGSSGETIKQFKKKNKNAQKS